MTGRKMINGVRFGMQLVCRLPTAASDDLEPLTISVYMYWGLVENLYVALYDLYTSAAQVM